jgi:hypothetical protein
LRVSGANCGRWGQSALLAVDSPQHSRAGVIIEQICSTTSAGLSLATK